MSGEAGEPLGLDPSRERELVAALRQYRNDMMWPPAADSRERRIAMINKLIGDDA